MLSGQVTSRSPVRQLPQVSLYNINGESSNLDIISKYKVTIIDFWFIPCGPCFIEMNMLHDIYARYKDNPNVLFLTISITDSAFVRPLTENRNALNNDTYTYFKQLAKLDTFKLPVYFMKEGTVKMISFVKSNQGFSGHSEPWGQNNADSLLAPHVFGFSANPTIFIFDKNGNTIYNHTGFLKKDQAKLENDIQNIISKYIQ
jgi:thiol-disulfide isomerase/thioredoxin